MIAGAQITAVLLAGGASRRMGRDKAFLAWGPDQQPLWSLQLEKLESLDPAEILISVKPGQDYDTSHEIVVDENPGAGPLAALAGCFDRAASPFVLPLAVDLPFVTNSLLDRIAASAGESGLVHRSGHFFEPFPALYPREPLLALMRENLSAGRDSMQHTISDAVENDILEAVSLSEEDSGLFKSVNTPEDLA